MPHARLVVVRGAGHSILSRESGTAGRDALRRFLADLADRVAPCRPPAARSSSPPSTSWPTRACSPSWRRRRGRRLRRVLPLGPHRLQRADVSGPRPVDLHGGDRDGDRADRHRPARDADRPAAPAQAGARDRHARPAGRRPDGSRRRARRRRHGELGPFGEETEPRELAKLLDDGLAKILDYWSGTFVPRPVQQPRIPSGPPRAGPTASRSAAPRAWTASSRSACPGRTSWPALGAEIAAQRAEEGIEGAYDLDGHGGPSLRCRAVGGGRGDLCLRGFGSTPRLADVRAAINAGPNG